MFAHIENKVVKRVLPFPFLSETGGIRACATAGGETFGSGPALTSPNTPFTPLDTTASQLSSALQRLVIPDHHGLRAIGISPDSLIDQCDIYVFGRTGDIDRVRISPGNPLVGDLGRDNTDFFMVGLPYSLPPVQTNQGPPNKVAVWDSTALTSGTGITFGTSPLRLELWYGDILPIRDRIRTPLTAFWKTRFFSATGADTLEMWVCTAGRRRVYLDIVAANATATITVQGIVMQKSEVGVNSDLANTKQILPATVFNGVQRYVLAGAESAAGSAAVGSGQWPMMRFIISDNPATNPIHSFQLWGFDD